MQVYLSCNKANFEKIFSVYEEVRTKILCNYNWFG